MIRATDLDLIGEATARGVRHLLPRQANDNGLPYSDYGLGGGRQICFARRAFAQPGPQAGGCARRRSSQVLFIIRTRVLYHRCDEKPARKFMFYPPPYRVLSSRCSASTAYRSSTARKVSFDSCTFPNCRIRFFPTFCLFSSFFLRVISPP